MTHYIAGARWIPGTNIPNNVRGECNHKHRTARTAQECVDKDMRLCKSMHKGAFSDRYVIRVEDDGYRVVVPTWEIDNE